MKTIWLQKNVERSRLGERPNLHTRLLLSVRRIMLTI